VALTDLSSRLGADEVRDLIGSLDYSVAVRRQKTEQILSEYGSNPQYPILGAELDGRLIGIIGLSLEAPIRQSSGTSLSIATFAGRGSDSPSLLPWGAYTRCKGLQRKRMQAQSASTNDTASRWRVWGRGIRTQSASGAH
jgi:hypothetical protein